MNLFSSMLNSKAARLFVVGALAAFGGISPTTPAHAATNYNVSVDCMAGSYSYPVISNLEVGDTITVSQTNDGGVGCYYSQVILSGGQWLNMSGTGTSTAIFTVVGPLDSSLDKIIFWKGLGSGYGATWIWMATKPTDPSVTMNTVTGGTATASATSVVSGGSVTLTATADAGYKFVSWSCDGGTLSSSTSNPATLSNITANVSCTPSFEVVTAKNYGQSDKTASPGDRSRTDIGGSPKGSKK
ncbi:MAG: InlB B-repeat-containing protein [Micrococcales bacterium]